MENPLLCINTAGFPGSISLWEVKHTVSLVEVAPFPSGKNMVSLFVPHLISFLKKNNLNQLQIKHLAINIGPGSYTGIRIGIASLQGFCLAHPDLRIIVFSELDTMAWGCPDSDKIICPVTDARLQQFYSAIYAPDRELLSPPATYTWDALVRNLPAGSRLVLQGVERLGSAAEACGFTWRPSLPEERLRGLEFLLNQAIRKNKFKSSNQINPLYLRPSAARPQSKSLIG
jgi:tRNA threonylcarbamoyladenosine biosynthesis protein TsaB